MSRPTQPPHQKSRYTFIRKYITWRKRFPLWVRLTMDAAMIVVFLYLAYMALMIALMILIPIVLLGALAKSGGQSDAEWYEQNDPRGYETDHRTGGGVHFD